MATEELSVNATVLLSDFDSVGISRFALGQRDKACSTLPGIICYFPPRLARVLTTGVRWCSDVSRSHPEMRGIRRSQPNRAELDSSTLRQEQRPSLADDKLNTAYC
ncbi:hypothetical protein PoB_003509200 [Plakobranchus ocellatus]|uniref:Uncharacterized protein n=1 Tax=Plakobranchus ocellatus TaxID=259542 RepID=A0AAV4AMV9_9GAST|nr:hypothetical protein PoB_003509200 [Plakobranchus ocellatus]